MHAWGSGGPSFRAWRSNPTESDVAAFAELASRYHTALEGARAIDRATLADAIREVAPGLTSILGREVVLAGFQELTPQQRRLRDALVGAGMSVLDGATESQSGKVHRYVAPTPRDEVRAALEWGRARALADGSQAIGIAVADLGMHRDDVRAAADDVFCPGLQVPGTQASRAPMRCRRARRCRATPWWRLRSTSWPSRTSASTVRLPRRWPVRPT